ncbi:LytTR family transcriptional regulator [Rhodobacteraceae bacterium HSP-20]|jgi:hypothetical protein|uniref:LytTR family transcriptional regulator n=1 Tax=Paragemmobacter amnigenus TaxID=2852097 RepID=A0ABS6J1D2_9RHOB|nr:LytTR family DNA-binding domain-containing protein [Rhodobacter amnigenus]MBU9697398.1 LytTR family transcriptional regulator [Rhodobacter amnigenus]MBV4388625.1 LytTR family transcriptional regulator [Rhodobacter amnigenus]
MLSDELQLRLINCGPLHITADEVRRMARHRYFLILFSLFVLPGMLVGLNAPTWWQATAIAMQGLVLSVMIMMIVMLLIRLWARRTREIHLSVIIAIAVLAVSVIDELLKPLTGRAMVEGPAHFLGNVVIILMLGEVGATFSFLFVAKPVLRELRAGSAQSGGAGGEETLVTVGTRTVDKAALHYVQAEGNYVLAQTAHGRLFEKATLGSVTAQLQSGDGIMVSRSCWIARNGFVDQTRHDGRLFLTMRDGRSIKVARTRQQEVQGWLMEQELERARAGRQAQNG